MKLSEIMTHEVEVIPPECSLDQAARKMRELDVGLMPVCDGERLVGMLTDRDITVRAVAEGMDPRSTRVKDAMTPDVTWCFEDQDTDEAARLMKENQVRRLVVLNRDKRLVGILSLGDLAVETGDDRASGETLEKVSQPARPNR